MRFLGVILRVLRLKVSVYKVLNLFCLGGVGEGEGLNPFVEVTVNSNEENSKDLCPNYVQEFGLRLVRVGGAGRPPFSISTKVVVYASAKRADTLPLFLLYPYMYSVDMTTV